MNALHTGSIASSNADMSDLDGYSLPTDYNFGLQSHMAVQSTDDFGFDPPTHETVYPKLEEYSPIEVDPLQQLPTWPLNGSASKAAIQSGKMSNGLPDNDFLSQMDRMMAGNIHSSASAISRFGQVTPPRSNSASSIEKPAPSPKTAAPERRKRNSKASVKEEGPTSAASTTSSAPPTTSSGRKRKTTRKASAASEEQDDKRRQSLEKNRLAAAKCRVNKKEKTEQLQRDSHDKAVHNAFLKEQVMRMKEEVQQMNAILLAHANCDGCKSPEEIQKHLNNLGNEFFAHHMAAFNYGDFSHLSLPGDLSAMGSDLHADFFSQDGSEDLINPPLPDFEQAGEFEVNSPMQTD